jgi:hypothetical protein
MIHVLQVSIFPTAVKKFPPSYRLAGLQQEPVEEPELQPSQRGPYLLLSRKQRVAKTYGMPFHHNFLHVQLLWLPLMAMLLILSVSCGSL